VSKVVVIETWRQLARIEVIQSFNTVITTTTLDMVFEPNTNVSKKGVIIRFVINLDRGSNRFSASMNLNRSSGLLTTNIGVVGTPQLVFTNPIMTTHEHKTIDKSPMSSITIRGYKNTNAKDSKGEYRRPSVTTRGIFDQRNGHFVRPNMGVFKYHDFKKDVNLDVHVRVLNFAVKANTETCKKNIINAFSYMLRDTTLDWCHNYMSKFLICIFSELT
jgi:hypothetical protein